MAIACTNLTTGTKTVDATSAATASISPTANRLLIATIITRRGDSAEPTAPTAAGNNLTWVSLGSAYTDEAGSSRKKVTWFRALGASPSAGAVTFTFSETQTSCTWAIDEFSGVDTSGTNGSGAIVQSVINLQNGAFGAATSNTATLSAFSSTDNATYGAFAGDQSLTPVAVGTGFTQVADVEETVESSTLVYTEFKTANDTSVDVSFTSGISNAILGAEIKAEKIAFDAASNSTYQAAASSYNWAHTVGTGRNRYLKAGVSMLSVAGSSVSSISWNRTVSITNLTSGESTSGASSYATASITATANQLVLLSCSTRTGITADPNQPTATGGGLTWEVIASTVYDNDSSSRRRLTLFRALGATPSAGAITIDYAGQAQTEQEWSINQCSGVDTSGTNGSGAVVQSATNRITDTDPAGTTIVATLGAFASTANATFGCFANEDSAWTPVVGSGFNALTDANTAAIDGHFTEWKSTNDTTVDITFGSQTGVGAIAVEIKAATQSLALIPSATVSSVSGAVHSEIWGLVAPASGAGMIIATLSAVAISASGAISFTGVNQTSPTEGVATATATNVGAADATVNVTTVATNDWIVDQVATDDTAITVGAGQTSRNNVTGAGGSGADSTEPATTAGSYTMSWTNVAALATWSTVAVALRDVNASTLGGSVSVSTMLMMGI